MTGYCTVVRPRLILGELRHVTPCAPVAPLWTCGQVRLSCWWTPTTNTSTEYVLIKYSVQLYHGAYVFVIHSLVKVAASILPSSIKLLTPACDLQRFYLPFDMSTPKEHVRRGFYVDYGRLWGRHVYQSIR